MKFQDLSSLGWLVALAPMVLLFVWAGYRRKEQLLRFAEAGLLPRLNRTVSAAARRWKAALVLLATCMVVLALARPAWNPTPQPVQRRGREVVFVLDVSRSMLATDLAPNRLERAKLAIHDCVERLGGDRVGLVAFAGTAAVKCPLTVDYGFFRMVLDGVGPDSIARGGTMIGDALRTAMDSLFADSSGKYRDIILITDGEDHESFPLDAAAELGKRGIRLIAIGLGDDKEGMRIPVHDEYGRESFLRDESGNEVWTKLDSNTLREMVAATPGGVYLDVATGAFDLGAIYEALVASAEKTDLESGVVEKYEEKFQIFLAAAFALLVAEMLIGERRSNGGA